MGKCTSRLRSLCFQCFERARMESQAAEIENDLSSAASHQGKLKNFPCPLAGPNRDSALIAQPDRGRSQVRTTAHFASVGLASRSELALVLDDSAENAIRRSQLKCLVTTQFGQTFLPPTTAHCTRIMLTPPKPPNNTMQRRQELHASGRHSAESKCPPSRAEPPLR